MRKRYSVAKKNYNGEVVVVDYEKLNGYQLSPKNGINYPGIKVNSILIVKPSFIEKILKKKVQKKLDYYLKYIVSIIDDEDDSGDFREALGNLERYKSVVEYKYRKYLDDKYIDLLLKKVTLIEREIKAKVAYQQRELEVAKRRELYRQMMEEENVQEKETRRRSR